MYNEVCHTQNRGSAKQQQSSGNVAGYPRPPLCCATVRSTTKYVKVRQRSFTGGVNNSDFAPMPSNALSPARFACLGRGSVTFAPMFCIPVGYVVPVVLYWDHGVYFLINLIFLLLLLLNLD
jgi:hypothetical protein